MEKQLHFFLIYFSVISVISIAGVHYYIKGKLKEKHDNGLLWVVAAIFFWILMGILEYLYACDNCSSIVDKINHIQKLKDENEYWRFRKIFSIFNSALFIYSLSYFKEGYLRLFSKLEKINLGLLAGITIGICFLTFPLPEEWWVRTDTIVSTVVAFSLSLSISLIFYQRGMKIMLLLSVTLGGLLIATQLIEMIKEIAVLESNTSVIKFWEETYVDNIIRMLSRPLIVINILALAISWLGNQSEIMIIQRPPVSAMAGNRLRFEQRGDRFFVNISLDSSLSTHYAERTERILLENEVFELNWSPYDFYHKCAKDVKNTGDFRHNDHTDNFDTKIKHLLLKMNMQLELDKVAGRPLTKLDLFKPVPTKKGIWTLVHEKDEIELGE